MITKRTQIKHEKTYQEWLAEDAARFKELAAQTPPGMQRELYLRRVRQAETSTRWLKSSEVQPPKGCSHNQERQ